MRNRAATRSGGGGAFGGAEVYALASRRDGAAPRADREAAVILHSDRPCEGVEPRARRSGTQSMTAQDRCLLPRLEQASGLGAEGAVREPSAVAARHDANAGLPDAAAGDAHVLGLEDAGRAFGSERALDRIHDAVGQPLLDLKPPREEIHHPSDLREPREPPSRKVGDVGAPEEREEMMDAD